MNISARALAIAALLGVLAGCGGKDDDPAAPPADTVTLTVNGTTTTYADTSPGVMITAYSTGSDAVLALTSGTLTFGIACPKPLPTSFPANDTCAITYIEGVNSASAVDTITITGLQTGPVGHFSGTFTNVTLSGTSTVIVSGSFSSFGTL